MHPVIALPLLASLFGRRAAAADNGLARTPQMGWDNWNALGCDVSEALLAGTADLVVGLGLRDLGYGYVVLDDCWSAGRSSRDGTLVADAAKFPRGMRAVADSLHARGLRFGMYGSAGRYTCGGYAGSLGSEEADARTWAGWGVDYLKYDNCYNEGQSGAPHVSYARYGRMADALNATGRPILYALCNWGEDGPWNWAATIANSWRISGDVTDSFGRPDDRCPCDGAEAYNCALPGFHCSVLNIINKASFSVSKAQPGAWNDLDMLEVGNGAMADAEYVTHFSLWSAAKSPLLMGNDLRAIRPADLSILANPAVIAVNQDPLGASAARRWSRATDDADEFGRAGVVQMWSGRLLSTTTASAGGGGVNDAVVVLINAGNGSTVLDASLADVFLDSGLAGTAAEVGMRWEVRDLWANRMSDDEARALIEAASSAGGNLTGGAVGGGLAVGGNSTTRYNATKTSYAEGLANKAPALLGKVSTTVEPSGTITALVERHGAAMLRLRAVPGGDTHKRDEL